MLQHKSTSKNSYRFFYRIVLIASILLSTNLISQAQEIKSSVLSSGGKAVTSSDFQISYTVGEAVGSVHTEDSESILSQGFEQPNYDSLVTSIFVNNIEIPTIIYPVPTLGPLNIQIGKQEDKFDFTVTLYDVQAKIMKRDVIKSGLNSLDISSFAAGSYIVLITTSDGTRFTSKIIEKIN